MIITEKEQKSFNNATNCMYCKKKFWFVEVDGKMREDKCRDHDHFTGKYRGASCGLCNKKEGKERQFIPIFFHNLSRYDSHMFIKELAMEEDPDRKLDLIPKTSESYISFSFGKLRFVDSYRFFQKSLEGVAEALKDDKKFKYTKEAIDKLDRIVDKDKAFKLLKQKGCFPYEWFDSFKKY